MGNGVMFVLLPQILIEIDHCFWKFYWSRSFWGFAF